MGASSPALQYHFEDYCNQRFAARALATPPHSFPPQVHFYFRQFAIQRSLPAASDRRHHWWTHRPSSPLPPPHQVTTSATLVINSLDMALTVAMHHEVNRCTMITLDQKSPHIAKSPAKHRITYPSHPSMEPCKPWYSHRAK